MKTFEPKTGLKGKRKASLLNLKNAKRAQWNNYRRYGLWAI